MDKKGGEVVLQKRFVYSKAEYQKTNPLEFHIQFGPGVTKFDGNTTFVIPIQPEFHKLLFPEFETQPDLFPGMHPCGNSIKKAYLCYSPTRQLKPGDNLLFYRSGDVKAITAVGIVEECKRSSSAEEIARYVSTRTVYSYDEIREMCQKETLAIKFRLVKILKSTISLEALKANGVITDHPQSIQKIKVGSDEWVKEATRLQPTF